jgi:ABC-type phosphate/phosphonate transport system substrate-binding protein
LKAQLRRALVSLHEDEDGRKLLQELQMRGFTAVTDADYNPVRQMIAKAAEVAW